MPFSPLQAVEQYAAQLVEILLIQQDHQSWFTVGPTDVGQQFAVSTGEFQNTHLDDELAASDDRLDRQLGHRIVDDRQFSK